MKETTVSNSEIRESRSIAITLALMMIGGQLVFEFLPKTAIHFAIEKNCF
jgi:hypothetical protein